jgi:hypothetical protein
MHCVQSGNLTAIGSKDSYAPHDFFLHKKFEGFGNQWEDADWALRHAGFIISAIGTSFEFFQELEKEKVVTIVFKIRVINNGYLFCRFSKATSSSI